METKKINRDQDTIIIYKQWWKEFWQFKYNQIKTNGDSITGTF